MPTFLSQNFSLVQDRNAKSNTNTYISSKSTSPIIEEEEEEEEEEHNDEDTNNDNNDNKNFIDDDTTIVDMTTLQQYQSRSKSKPNHFPITIPPSAHPKLDLKLLQSSPVTATPLIRPLSFPAATPPDSIALAPSTSAAPLTTIQDQQKQEAIVISIPTISIWTAAEQHDVNTLTYYIKHHPNPVALLNKRDPKTECTLLHLAVSSSNSTRPNPYTVIDLLLSHGADPCARNVYNVQALHTTPLHCTELPEDSVELLLNHGADVNCRDGDGWTPLHYAARFCRPHSLGAVLTLLVQRGADPSAVDASQKTPIFALLANGDHVDAFAYLIQRSNSVLMLQSRGDFLDSTSRRTYRGTVVLQAAKYLRVECLEWLVQSKQAINQITPALTHEELSYAIQLVQQQQHQQQHKSQRIMSLLHQVSAKMEKAPPSTVTNAIQRRLSIISTKRRDHRRHTLSSSSAPRATHRRKHGDQDEDDDDDDETFLVNSPTFIKRMTNFFTRYKRPIVIQEQVV